MSSWTQFEEDSYRLPEGMKRIEYDADTKVYTFQDRDGKRYQGAPGEEYGVLTPVENVITGSSRVGAFYSESDEPPRPSARMGTTPSTFHDILPATLITTTKSPVDRNFLSHGPPQPSSRTEKLTPRSRFIDAVRRSTLPRMQEVVHDLRRSVISTRSKGQHPGESDRLLPKGSSDLSRSNSMVATRSDHSPGTHRRHSNLSRSDSVTTARSGISVDTPMSIDR
ncbi:hypothetical protein H0H87_002121 [Tephrocybe sp. NHM501043]|nr:hypothetical protein H0H87_002121 [Tephrocybe sp. NHM501043]